MSRKRSERPVGRPNIEIDKDVFERLCAIQCTQVEMACFLGVSEDTIERWCMRTYGVKFAEIFKQKEWLVEYLYGAVNGKWQRQVYLWQSF